MPIASAPCRTISRLRPPLQGLHRLDGITRVPVGESSDTVTRLRFRRSAGAKPAPDVVERQTKMALIAFQAFGSKDAARSFLNGEHDQLGGRPIEIAGRDEAGFDSVRAALASSLGQG